MVIICVGTRCDNAEWLDFILQFQSVIRPDGGIAKFSEANSRRTYIL